MKIKEVEALTVKYLAHCEHHKQLSEKSIKAFRDLQRSLNQEQKHLLLDYEEMIAEQEGILFDTIKAMLG